MGGFFLNQRVSWRFGLFLGAAFLLKPLEGTAKDLDLNAGQFVLTIDAPVETPHSRADLPRNFRTSVGSFIRKGTPPTRLGLKELKISGSGEFNRSQFEKMVAQLKTLMTPEQKLLVLDLRQEPHALVADYAISWFGKDNGLNFGKTVDQIEADEQSRIQALKSQSTIAVKKWIYKISKKTGKNKSKSIDATLPISAVNSEREFVEKNGAEYFRLGVPDHQRPDDSDVDLFLKKYLEIRKQNYWVAIHCAAGAGRTTTFMTLMDMLSNCQKVPERDILLRQYMIGGSVLSAAEGSGNGSRKEWAKIRAEFIHNFYRYCKAQAPEFKQTWSQWIRSNSAPASSPSAPNSP